MAVRFSPKILALNVVMFETIFCQSRTMFEIGFGLRTDVFGFCCVFWCLGLFLP